MSRFVAKIAILMMVVTVSMFGQQVDGVLNNPVILFLERTGDQQLQASVVLTAPCVQYYTATLVLQAYDGVGWQNIDFLSVNMGGLDTLQAGFMRLKGRRVLGNFTNLPKYTKEVGKGLFLRVRIDQHDIGSVVNSGCGVGMDIRPFTHIETPYYNWGDPEKYPKIQRTNWLQFAGVVNDKLYFFASKGFVLFQNAGTDYARVLEVFPVFGRAEVSLDFFRRDIPINIYFVESNGSSWSGTPPIWISEGKN